MRASVYDTGKERDPAKGRALPAIAWCERGTPSTSPDVPLGRATTAARSAKCGRARNGMRLTARYNMTARCVPDIDKIRRHVRRWKRDLAWMF